MLQTTFLFLILISLLQPLRAKEYDIQDFGAVPGNLSTKAIQKAINACHNDGGGTVVVPAGIYITATLFLKSHVNLYLGEGAELRSSENPDDFAVSGGGHSGIVFAQDETDISITGQGMINAMGTSFYDENKNHFPVDFDRNFTRQKNVYLPEGEFFTDGPIKRKEMPGMTIVFFHCTKVTIKDITIRDTPVWAIRFGYCEDVRVDGISLQNNLLIPNSDGIHMTVSRNVRIANCDIRCGDDAIAITGFAKIEDTPGFSSAEQGKYHNGNKSIYSENIQVTNCHLQSRSSGIRVGYGQHPIRRIVFDNIVISGSNRGIGIFSRDSSSIEELIFSNIIIDTRLHNGVWWGNGEPIHLSSISRFEGEPAGGIKNVQFNHITATSEHGILLYGMNACHLENIRFNQVCLHLRKGTETMAYGGNFDLRPNTIPDLQIFEHDIPGFYAQYTDNLSITGFSLDWDNNLPPFFTNGLECLEVRDLYLDNFNAGPNPNSPDSQDLKLTNTTLRKQDN